MISSVPFDESTVGLSNSVKLDGGNNSTGFSGGLRLDGFLNEGNPLSKFSILTLRHNPYPNSLVVLIG